MLPERDDNKLAKGKPASEPSDTVLSRLNRFGSAGSPPAESRPASTSGFGTPGALNSGGILGGTGLHSLGALAGNKKPGASSGELVNKLKKAATKIVYYIKTGFQNKPKTSAAIIIGGLLIGLMYEATYVHPEVAVMLTAFAINALIEMIFVYALIVLAFLALGIALVKTGKKPKPPE